MLGEQSSLKSNNKPTVILKEDLLKMFILYTFIAYPLTTKHSLQEKKEKQRKNEHVVGAEKLS